MGIVLKSSGSFKNTMRFLTKMQNSEYLKAILEEYGRQGVSALSSATPTDSGKTESSWYYEVHISDGLAVIDWLNSNVNKGVNIAVIIQMGHGTRNGGYVQGRDYINPAIQPVFDDIANAAWKEVTNA